LDVAIIVEHDFEPAAVPDGIETLQLFYCPSATGSPPKPRSASTI
jgi:hypothetical protein